MNSGLKRLAATRGRMIHVSKRLEPDFLVLENGVKLPMGLRVSKQKINGRNDGNTAAFGFNAMKRAGARVRRDFKSVMWHGR
jgi:hypothetical protein